MKGSWSDTMLAYFVLLGKFCWGKNEDGCYNMLCVSSSKTEYTILPQGSKAARCMICSFDFLKCLCAQGALWAMAHGHSSGLLP